MGVEMIVSRNGPTQYAILFGDDQFMVFSLFQNVDDNGETRFGLFCSDIIETSSKIFPIIPLTIFMLLGENEPAPLIPSPIPIPSATLGQKEKKARKKRTTKPRISQSVQKFMKEVCGDIWREFDLTCKSSIS
jgi:hypothetical protein